MANPPANHHNGQRLPSLHLIHSDHVLVDINKQQSGRYQVNQHTVPTYQWIPHQAYDNTVMRDVYTGPGSGSSRSNSVEMSDASATFQGDYGTPATMSVSPVIEALIPSRVESQKLDVDDDDDDDDNNREPTPRNRKNNNTKEDRQKHQCQLQALADILEIGFGYRAPTTQVDNNGAKSGLFGDKKETLAAVIALLDYIAALYSARALQEGADPEDCPPWSEICAEAVRNLKAGFALPPRSFLRGPDNRQCSNGRDDQQKKGSDKQRKGKMPVGDCIFHAKPACGLKPDDYRSCRLRIRRENAKRRLAKLASGPLANPKKVWERMRDLESESEEEGKR